MASTLLNIKIQVKSSKCSLRTHLFHKGTLKPLQLGGIHLYGTCNKYKGGLYILLIYLMVVTLHSYRTENYNARSHTLLVI